MTVVEVAPRDGLQNEAVVLSTAAKVALVEDLVRAGARRVEVASFVDPRRVPQMADPEAVLAGLPRGAASYIGLVLNDRGVGRAVDAGVDEVNVVVPVSETFSLRNQGRTVDEMVEASRRMVRQARSAGLLTTVTLAVAFGCPFEGEVSTEQVAGVLDRVLEAAPDEVALADTIGVGVPRQVEALADAVAGRALGLPLRWHFHNTRNTGYANAHAALAAAGSTPVALDSSVGGVGGCPFAPGASGNIATEELAYQLERSGLAVGLDVPGLMTLGTTLLDQLGRPGASSFTRAGLFPHQLAD